MTEHAHLLGILARARPEGLKALAERLLPNLGVIEVLQSRTGLVMLPMRDTVKGTDFHLGEVLVAEAHIRAPSGEEGYGMIVGRDLDRAMAMAVVDLTVAVDLSPTVAEFVEREAAHLAAMDRETLRAVEATRVKMETF
ncbi:phosphonate C-P lyase system protein PhnG [Aquamicrobium sp. LC103]|uniref:phosphonate C-P lyase system protein PhnG n=1 Tax=Aquamicrobium sp. LC103 TaxID=1120658 RepID=UPI00063E6F6B|nr:phosphonate C-P lyase system protein PhnG [Aquamicrobium sp. LC103]TKT69849.1 phosphonate C-P lyase system protein PhnG [Aquamicrobium sp. LC103]